jgi:hypothetical protein
MKMIEQETAGVLDLGYLVGAAGAAFLLATLSRPVLKLPPALASVAVCILYLAWPRIARRWAPSRVVLRNREFGASVALGALLVAVACTFIAILFPFDTAYAPGYSEAAFRSVQIGDSREEVIARLGEPLSIHSVGIEGTETWGEWLRYSRSPSGKNYLVRQFMLDSEGRVVKILRETYWD